MSSEHTLASVIIPVHNASRYLPRCLQALLDSSYPNYEIIVVDDASTDNSVDVCTQFGVTVFKLEKQSGPAQARNHGAHKAKGDILFFVDSDVVVRKNTIKRVMGDFEEKPEIAAVFGSYDTSPAERDFFSQYKNLYHHFVHQQSSSEAVTFWAGCGAIRREIFLSVGEFDGDKYPNPSIEDIELGYRLTSEGYKIFLDKNLQVTHLKKWDFINLLRTDIFSRAVPWTKLILENKRLEKDLNLKTSDRVSAGLAGIAVGALPFTPLFPSATVCVVLLFIVILTLNFRLYRFFIRCNGLLFTIFVFPMQLLYYLYSACTYTSILCIHTIKDWCYKQSI